MAHIMFVRTLIALLFLTTTANAGSMKELALIALLGGPIFECDDVLYISKAHVSYVDVECDMQTYGNFICRTDEVGAKSWTKRISFGENNGHLTMLSDGKAQYECSAD